mmetsp:Transcript_15336/g.13872  ORF Transcript_15336/g.13872 Transcript_15336/m.13872 type:complete len:378 (+) Transcript_15336:38-1171(+)
MPDKYKQLGDFHLYASGEKKAPIFTIFIGGNHEASNVLHNLYYGGFVAPNIYYLGFAGVVWYKGIRIAGVSGIYNYQDYKRGHFERFPYDYGSVKSIYHLRELEIYRLMCLSSNTPIDIFLSHDWPQGIVDYGDKNQLLRIKPYFAEDINSGRLGSPPLMNILQSLKPSFWFSAHLHVKFPAIVVHSNESKQMNDSVESLKQNLLSKINGNFCAPTNQTNQVTKFLALDKVLPNRQFIQILRVPRQQSGKNELSLDCEWLAILRATHNLLSTSKSTVNMPSNTHIVSSSELEDITSRLNNDFVIPNVIACTEIPYEGSQQTDSLLDKLGLHHIWTRPLSTTNTSTYSTKSSTNATTVESNQLGINVIDKNELDIDDI